LRRHLREVAESLGPRDLDALAAFADFLRARRVARAARSPEEIQEGEEVPSSSEIRSEIRVAPPAEER
jgi:hypothetical protein